MVTRNKNKVGKVSLYARLVFWLSSNRFFHLVLVVAALQGLWYAFSFKPGIFDEGTHFGMTDAYSHRLDPFISHQTPDWDKYGEVTRNPSYLYYYLLSWPLRFIRLFTDSQVLQVAGLRIIMLAFFLAGLVYFRRLFSRIGAPKAISHIVLLFFILTPAFAPFAGALNYDNVIFFLFPLSLLLAMNIVESKTVGSAKLAGFLMVGIFGTLIKFAFLALYTPLFLYVIYSIYRKFGKNTGSQLKISFQKLSIPSKAALVIGLVIAVGLFIERPVYNLVKYHNFSASCTRLIGEQRCSKNYTVARNIKFRAEKPANFAALDPFQYSAVYWLPGLINTETKVIPSSGAMPFMKLLYSIGVLAGITLALVYLRQFLKWRYMPLLVVISFIYIVFFFADVYSAYRDLGQPVAISSRYLMPILPIFMLLVALALRQLAGKYKRTLLAGCALVALLLFTQGGSIATTSLAPTMEAYYWQNSTALNFNHDLNSFFHKIVIERSIL